MGEKICIGDLNGHITKGNKDYNDVYNGFDFWNKNDEERLILDFAICMTL